MIRTTLRRRRGALTGLVLGLGLALAAAVFAAPAGAINTYNAQPAPERTEVGAFMALYDRDGDGVADRFDWFCSGAMISNDVFLTAAHCTSDWPAGTRFFVSLEQDVQARLDDAAGLGLSPAAAAAWFLANGYAVEGTAVSNPDFGGAQNDPHDIGVVDFRSRAVTPADRWTFTPATLPTAGLLDELGPRTLDTLPWTVVGYGTQEAARGPGGQTHPGGGVRMKASLGFDALNKAWVRLAMIEPQGWGGACYGDSGGPNFVTVNGQLILAATTITGDTPCYATNVVYRTDTASARAFLAQFVTLP